MKGCLKLSVDFKESRSYVKDLYFSAPFKVMNVSPRKSLKLDLMMMSSSPGMLDQDEYQVDISLAQNSWLNLFNQAYQRIYPSVTGTLQDQVFRLGKNSTLVYLATPLVPHQSAQFTGKTSVYLEDNATLIMGEIITRGRKNQEHPFAFHLLKLDVVVIFEGDGLIFKEKQHLAPNEVSLSQMGLYDTFTHQASLYIFNNHWDHITLTAELLEILNGYPGLSAGVTSSWKYGTIVKVLGTKAEELVNLLNKLKEQIVQRI